MSDSEEEAPLPVLQSPDENTLRIMVSTDNHLGYNERDAVRGMDSFAAFEEVLYLAKKFECDMVLLAGDLFHENRPSRTTLFRTMQILRKYCMGDNPVRLQTVSDPTKNFASNHVVNYQDPNYSVDLPIFSIHGNHDDPIRDGQGTSLLAALDLLSACNLVNYIGKQEKIDQIEIAPVLFKKGTTDVALFSLGSMRDERLNRMWNSQKVRFQRPEQDMGNNTNDDDDDEDDDSGYFNIFTLHQNRDLGRGSKNCLHETMIPEWMDIVVWGHEHECLVELFESMVGTFRITQPGSSVATSLVAGEAARKKVGVLDICGKKFRMSTVPLTQVRPFVTAEVSLQEHREGLDPDDPRVDEHVTAVLQEEVKVMVCSAQDKRRETLEEARKMGNDAGDDDSPLMHKLEKPGEPLVRIRVEHTGFSTLSNQRFGAHFVGQVANPEDILLFYRKKDPSKVANRKTKVASAPIPPEELVRTDMDDLVNGLLEGPETQLKLFNEKLLAEAMENFVEKKVTTSLDDAADRMLSKRQKALIMRKAEAEEEDQQQKATENNPVDKSMESEKSPNVETARSKTKNSTRRSRNASVDDSSLDGREKENHSASEDDFDEEDIGKSRASHAKRQRKRGHDDDKDVDEHVANPPRAKAASKRDHSQLSFAGDSKRKAARRKALDDLSDIEEIIEAPSKAKSTRKKTRGKRVDYSIDSDGGDLDSDDDPEIVPVAEAEDDDDDEIIDDDSDASGRVVKKGKTPSSRSRAQKQPTKRSTTRKKAPASRSRATAKHKFDDSDDELSHDNFGDSMELDEDWGTAKTRSQF